MKSFQFLVTGPCCSKKCWQQHSVSEIKAIGTAIMQQEEDRCVQIARVLAGLQTPGKGCFE